MLAQSVSSVCDFRLEREIASTDSGIDKLVYELYGITGDEGKNIEEVRERDAA
jgi:hypothetical protein